MRELLSNAIENLKYNKMLDPSGQAWQNGMACFGCLGIWPCIQTNSVFAVSYNLSLIKELSSVLRIDTIKQEFFRFQSFPHEVEIEENRFFVKHFHNFISLMPTCQISFIRKDRVLLQYTIVLPNSRVIGSRKKSRIRNFARLF